GRRVAKIEEGGALPTADAEVVAWRGSLAGFGALIGASDLYIGYDSACQHIAAALGVRTIDIFAGFRSPRMAQRWKPSGAAEVRMIVADPHRPADPERILAAVLEAAR
ncbi:MAG TPA: glycosyltransferase family 9 protein, partial [Bryobacterales bacterium]|nr:glycosyltransferase family 9 protein [Bryobacterales bacterium]